MSHEVRVILKSCLLSELLTLKSTNIFYHILYQCYLTLHTYTTVDFGCTTKNIPARVETRPLVYKMFSTYAAKLLSVVQVMSKTQTLILLTLIFKEIIKENVY